MRDLILQGGRLVLGDPHHAALRDRMAFAGFVMWYTVPPVSRLALSRTCPACRSRVSAARVVCGSQPVAAIMSSSVAPCFRCIRAMSCACFDPLRGSPALVAPSFLAERSASVALGFLSRLVFHGDGRRAGLRDLEPERLLLLVGTPGGLIALDPYLLQEAEAEELRDRGLGGTPLQRLGQRGEPILTLRCRGEDDQLGVGQLHGASFRGSDGSCRHCPEPAMAKGQRADRVMERRLSHPEPQVFGLPCRLFETAGL